MSGSHPYRVSRSSFIRRRWTLRISQLASACSIGGPRGVSVRSWGGRIGAALRAASFRSIFQRYKNAPSSDSELERGDRVEEDRLSGQSMNLPGSKVVTFLLKRVKIKICMMHLPLMTIRPESTQVAPHTDQLRLHVIAHWKEGRKEKRTGYMVSP